MVAPLLLLAGGLILGGTVIDSLNKGRVSVPLVSDVLDAGSSIANAIDSFAQLLTYSFLPVANKDDRFSATAALNVWSSIPIYQVLTFLAGIVPVSTVLAYKTPDLLRVLNDIDLHFPELTKKQKDILKISLMGLSGLSAYWIYENILIYRFQKKVNPFNTEQALSNIRGQHRDELQRLETGGITGGHA